LANKHYLYTTVDGDTFDIIALAFYGDEHYSTEIMKANPEFVGCVVFSSGTDLKVPIIESPASSTLPPWKR
jgi:phage tail protein X